MRTMADNPADMSPEERAIIDHLMAEEAEARDATLTSLESFELFISSQPALRQMIAPDQVADMFPAIVNFFRAMFTRSSSPDDGDNTAGGQ